jgi:hypothetical protein
MFMLTHVVTRHVLVIRTVAFCMLALVITSAFPQGSDELKRHEDVRRARRELIDSMSAASDAAWKSFLESATRDGVYLECRKALPSPSRLVLYRGFAFRADESGKLLVGFKYRVDEIEVTWWDDTERQWKLQLDGWRLQGKRTAADSGISDECKIIRGDTAEIKAVPPEFPQAK